MIIYGMGIGLLGLLSSIMGLVSDGPSGDAGSSSTMELGDFRLMCVLLLVLTIASAAALVTWEDFDNSGGRGVLHGLMQLVYFTLSMPGSIAVVIVSLTAWAQMG